MHKWGQRIQRLHHDNGVRIVNFVTSKFQLFRTRRYRTEIFIGKPGPLLMGRLTTRLITY
jgi:hypothetical protein